MVKTLFKLVATVLKARQIPLAEAAGATAVVIGLVLWLGAPAGWIAVGVALLAKSFEWDLARGSTR